MSKLTSKLLKLSSVSVAAIVLGMSAADLQAAPIVIDGFTAATASYPLFDTSVGGPTVTSGTDAGLRVVTLSTTAKAANLDFTEAGVFPTDLGGILDYNSTAGASGVTTISYGTDAGLASSAIVIPDDYSAYFEFLAYDLPSGAPLSVSLTLFNGAASATQTTSLTTAGAQTVAIDTNLFSSAIRSNVTGLRVTLTAPAAADYRLGSIVADTTTVLPEPAALAFTAPAALTLLARRRRV